MKHIAPHRLPVLFSSKSRQPGARGLVSRRKCHVAVTISITVLVAFFWPTSIVSAQSPSDTLDYSEQFDAGQAAGWDLVPGWSLVASESGYALYGDGLGHAHLVYRTTVWGDSRLRCRIRLDADAAHVSYRDGDIGRYYLRLSAESTTLSKQVYPDTFFDNIQTGPGISYATWHSLEIDGADATLTVTIDRTTVLSNVDPDPILNGGLSFESFDGSFWVDDIEVYVPSSKAPPADLVWVRTGGPLGGLGYDIRVSPSTPTTLFVTDAFSGVFRSVDTGADWTPANDGITTRAGLSGDAIPVFCLSFDPSNSQTLWIGTQNTRGIFKSTDGGTNWVQKVNGITETTGITFRGLTVDPNVTRTIYAAAEISSWVWAGEERSGREFDMTRGVVYKSVDGGENWAAIWRGDNLARYVWVDPRDSNVLYISTGIFDREAANSIPASRSPGGEGVLKSINGGSTWTPVNNGIGNLYVGSLFMHPADPDILLAGTGNNQYYNGAGVYRTADGGASWQETLSDVVITAVEIAQADPTIAYAGGTDAMYRSEDGGLTWTQTVGGSDGWGAPGVRAGFPIDIQVDPTDSNRLFVNNYGGGNFFSDNGGRTWAVASRGYTGAQTRDIAVDPAAPGRVFAAARSGLFLSGNGGDDWVGRSTPPAASLEWNTIAVDPANSRHLLTSNNWNSVILSSADDGQTWVPVSAKAGANQGWRVLVFAPSDPQRVYAGLSAYFSAGVFDDRMPAAGIHVSRNGGASWTAANDATSADANVIGMAVSPTDPGVAFAATGNHGVLKTIDSGDHWINANEGLPVAPVALSIAIDPTDPDRLLVGLDAGGVYRSEDGGVTWTSSVAGMNPQSSVSDIVFDTTDSTTLFASDRMSGVYRSTDGGTTWVRLTNGLRTRAVNALALSKDGAHLYAATEGEGVFRLDVNSVPPPSSEVVVNNNGGTPTDDGAVTSTGDSGTNDGGTGDPGTTDGGSDAPPEPNSLGGGSPRPSTGCGAGMIVLAPCVSCLLLLTTRRRVYI